MIEVLALFVALVALFVVGVFAVRVAHLERVVAVTLPVVLESRVKALEAGDADVRDVLVKLLTIAAALNVRIEVVQKMVEVSRTEGDERYVKRGEVN